MHRILAVLLMAPAPWAAPRSAAASIPPERFIHVRVEVAGSRAEVFVDQSAAPVLTVTDLERGRSSGGVALFVSGRPVFSGDNTYLSRDPRYLGIMTVDHEAVYLPLDEGDNELQFAVSEGFGGWGMIARLEDRGGIELRTEPPEGTAPIRRSAGAARPGEMGGW